MPTQPTAYPYDVRIAYPVDGSLVAGYITIVGSASHPRFLQYALEWGPDPNPSNLWYPLTAPQRNPVINGGLGAWNTSQTPDGVYQLRLHLWLNDGTETFDIVTGLRISNTAPTAIPTLTPTPRPNHPPVLSPIPSQQVNAGSSVNVNVTASDPDGDAVNLFVSSSNDSIAKPQVISPTQISVSGVTAGSATITVTANDNHGGLTSTAFIVTVQGQNQAPNLSPVQAQTIEVGQTVDVTIAASDPDGDVITVTAQSDDGTVLSATAPNVNTVRLVGVAVGTANVTVSVSDGHGGVVNTAFQVNIGAVNLPPVINAISNQTLTAGDTVNVLFTASDPNNDTLTATAGSDTPGVVSASVTAPDIIQLVAAGVGTATVTLQVDDGVNQPTIATFSVTVVAGNAPPSLDPISPQTMGAGESRDVVFSASDPDNDPLNVTANSDNNGVVTATVSATDTITLLAVGAGTATVTVNVDDGGNPAVIGSFTVSVAAVNLPPTVDAIGAQNMAVGATLDVGYSASDPESDPLNAVAVSDNEAVVSASVTGPNVIGLVANAEGTATVTLSVDDGSHPAVSVPFTVTVSAGNSAPSVDPIGPQSVGTGATLDVGYAASDPDNDPLTAVASSDNTGIVTAAVTAPNVITLTGVADGTANVTLTVEDGVTPAVSVIFSVSVSTANLPPVVNPIGPQSMVAGATLDVGYTASDPDADPLTAVATSDNPGVVTASVTAPNVISLAALAEGTANVTLAVEDGSNLAVSVIFSVSVGAANAAPTIQPVGPQTLSAGTTLDVSYIASDPENDLLTALATSDNNGIVTATISSPNVITLTGVAAGTANVTLSVEDGSNLAVSTVFGVTVTAPNTPPSIGAIGPQVLDPGATLDVTYTVTDLENDPINAVASSDNTGVVLAMVSAPNVITLTGIGAGAANVTLTVDDGVNLAVSTSFGVTVNAVNTNPVVDPIGPQSVDQGATITVPVTASDADGDLVSLSAVSDNPTVATAMGVGPTSVSVTGVVPGTANITVEASDGKGGVGISTFVVTVTGVNNPPVITPLVDQSLKVGEQTTVAVEVSDADGDVVVLTAISQNPGVVNASAVNNNSVVLDGIGAGTALVDVTADDARGGVVTVSFNVTVSSAPPPFDLMAYPVIPDIPQQMAQTLNQVYQSGVNNFGNQAGAFSKIGDESLESSNFMAPYAVDGYDLGNNGGLQAVIDVYRATSVRPGIDPAINSLTVDSVAADNGYGIDTLSGPPPGGAPCSAQATTLVACELEATRPAIALISFNAANVTYLGPDVFRSELQTLVSQTLSNYGVIPVLATIPAGNGYDANALAPFNQVIVEVATQSGVAGVPLWNLARAMQERGIGDPNSVSPEGAASLTDASLAYGANVRNLTALQTLQVVRQSAGMP